MKFTKMHGCGNDYVYINCFEEKIDEPEKLATEISDRHFGAGSDGLILICPSEKADCRMRMFNNDGSESEMCGNGIRCVAKYVYDNGIAKKDTITVETLAGIKTIEVVKKENDKAQLLRVDMGAAIFEAEKIPVKAESSPVKELKIKAADREFTFTCVSMGNPHVVTFIDDDIKNFDVAKYGRIIEVDEHFPKKTNVEFCNIKDNTHIEMRVWERGSGETLACGTGACATAAAAMITGKCKKDDIEIKLLGGVLTIRENESDDHIYMTGPAETVYEGEWKK